MQRIVINLESCIRRRRRCFALPFRMTFQSATAPQRAGCKRTTLPSLPQLAAHVAAGAKLQSSLHLSAASFYFAFSFCFSTAFRLLRFDYPADC